MSEIKNGIRKVLNIPYIYDFFQNLMGADSARKNLVQDYIKPFKDCRILDIGCGTSRILDYLIDVEYHGYDSNERYINDSIARYGDRGNFHCKTINKLNISSLGKFDRIIAIGVLHHLDDQACINISFPEFETIFKSIYN